LGGCKGKEEEDGDDDDDMTDSRALRHQKFGDNSPFVAHSREVVPTALCARIGPVRQQSCARHMQSLLCFVYKKGSATVAIDDGGGQNRVKEADKKFANLLLCQPKVELQTPQPNSHISIHCVHY
jgi:hypothetical protein